MVIQAVTNISAIGAANELKLMTIVRKKNPSYLVKHRRKWQVKLVIPRDVRWAFDNKTTFKRSTGCNLIDIKQAVNERDRIVLRFKQSVERHRLDMAGVREDVDGFEEKFKNPPYPMGYQVYEKLDKLDEKTANTNVDGWIKERLLDKGKNTKVLRYDFWNIEKKKGL